MAGLVERDAGVTAGLALPGCAAWVLPLEAGGHERLPCRSGHTGGLRVAVVHPLLLGVVSRETWRGQGGKQQDHALSAARLGVIRAASSKTTSENRRKTVLPFCTEGDQQTCAAVAPNVNSAPKAAGGGGRTAGPAVPPSVIRPQFLPSGPAGEPGGHDEPGGGGTTRCLPSTPPRAPSGPPGPADRSGSSCRSWRRRCRLPTSRWSRHPPAQR